MPRGKRVEWVNSFNLKEDKLGLKMHTIKYFISNKKNISSMFSTLVTVTLDLRQSLLNCQIILALMQSTYPH